MLIDAYSFRDRSVIETDVCIVGAGPAGSTLAREMNGETFRVCLIESGGIAFDRAIQELARLGIADSAITPAARNRRRQFGGNAHLWTVGRRPARSLVRYLPLDDIDFATRPWVPHSGWPLGRKELDPYYVRAHRACGIGEFGYSVSAAQIPNARPLPLDPKHVRTSVEWFGTSRPFVREALNELERSANVTILVHANASALEERATGGVIDRLQINCLNGTSHTVSASVFVLATGGIENARLLLLSNGRRTAGVGNEHDLVGRFFMDHLHWRGVLVPADRRIFELAGLYDVRETADGRIMGCKLNLTDAVVARERLLNGALKIEARLPARGWVKRVDTYARLVLRHRQIFPCQYGWSALHGNAKRFCDFGAYLQIELPPIPTNRVTLGEERDRFGRPLPAVHWKWDDLTLQSVRRAYRLLADAFARAGIGRLEMLEEAPGRPANSEGINHHLGTTRMHVDPTQGVVDANCQVHGVSNLFVAGSSVFPTGGYANPTLTIAALAIRLADHIRARLHAVPHVRSHLAEVPAGGL